MSIIYFANCIITVDAMILTELFSYKLDATVDSLVENNFYFVGVSSSNKPSLTDQVSSVSPAEQTVPQSYEVLRTEAVEYHKLRVEAFEKARSAFKKGMTDVAFYYAQEVKKILTMAKLFLEFIRLLLTGSHVPA